MLSLSVRAASCIDAAPPSSDWGHSGLLRDPRADTQSGFIAVMRDYTFSCEGTVSQWRVQWRLQGHRLSSSRTRKDKECQIFFNFHVLRPTSTCGIASIGNNSMTVEVASLTGSVQESTVFNVSKADRISVEAGDVVGIAVMLEGCSQGSRYELSIMESTNESALSEVYYRRQQLGVDPTVDSEYICDVSDERSNSRDSDMSTGRSRSSQSTRRGTTEPTGGMSSHRKTTRPGIPRPGIPRPGTPQSGTPQPDTPRPDTSQPDTPRPDTPRPSTPQPGTPHPEGDTDEGEDRSSTPRPSTRPEGDTDEGEDRRRTRYSSRYRNGSADEREERGRTRYSSRYSSHSRSRDPYTPHLEGDTHGREDRNETDIEHDGDTGEIESERTKAKKNRRVRSRDDREDTRHTRHTTGRNTDEREDTDRSHTRSKTPKTRRTKTKTKTTKSQTREDEEYQLYFGAPLIDAIIGKKYVQFPIKLYEAIDKNWYGCSTTLPLPCNCIYTLSPSLHTYRERCDNCSIRYAEHNKFRSGEQKRGTTGIERIGNRTLHDSHICGRCCGESSSHHSCHHGNSMCVLPLAATERWVSARHYIHTLCVTVYR